jgi:hypothetical protein
MKHKEPERPEDQHTIPFEDKFLICRPPRKLAFVRNRAMAKL